MVAFTRRHILALAATLPLTAGLPLLARAAEVGIASAPPVLTVTKTNLAKAFHSEMAAYVHYRAFVSKAIEEHFDNIAYMFHAFSLSEKIHADNYRRILSGLNKEITPKQLIPRIASTQENVQKAAEKELEKIKTFYPELLEDLEHESHDVAIINCMYAWKSHRQHEEKILEIQKYSGFFFDTMASRIEDMNLDFHVCEVCGSTIDEVPHSPCIICNKSMVHYRSIPFPV